MKRRFLSLLSVFQKLFRKEELPLLPRDIGENEKLCRTIYSPINVADKGKLRPNSFRTPSGKDEVSVNRLNFTSPTFCKIEAKRNQNPAIRNYYGFAILTQNEVLESDCETVYSPITHSKAMNYFHADIKIGYIPAKGEELPSRFQKKVIDLTKKARFYVDPNIDSENWEGEELT